MSLALATTNARESMCGSVAAPPPFVRPQNQQSKSHALPSQVEGKTLGISRAPYPRRIRAKSGNVLRWGNRDVALGCREILEATYDGDQSKAKAAADDAASSPRAAKNWLAAENPMSLTAFLNAYHANPTFKAWARKILLLEEDRDPAFQAELASFIRTAQRLGSGGE